MYDQFSQDYDRFVDWNSRLAYELPFILKLLEQHNVQSVLDTACGTGQHAIALAKKGLQVYGADLFPEMIDLARANAHRESAAVQFEAAGFGELRAAFPEPVDALLCLGNSLPHVKDLADLNTTLADFAQMLKPDGICVLQSRNFDKVMQQEQRWMGPQTFQTKDETWVYVRFYDFLPDGHIRFNILTLHKQGDEPFSQTTQSTLLTPLLAEPLQDALGKNGFTNIQLFGGLEGSAFTAEQSENTVVVAVKA